jgi:hypothetical protein
MRGLSIQHPQGPNALHSGLGMARGAARLGHPGKTTRNGLEIKLSIPYSNRFSGVLNISRCYFLTELADYKELRYKSMQILLLLIFVRENYNGFD